MDASADTSIERREDGDFGAELPKFHREGARDITEATCGAPRRDLRAKEGHTQRSAHVHSASTGSIASVGRRSNSAKRGPTDM